jgi:hypothetical protein
MGLCAGKIFVVKSNQTAQRSVVCVRDRGSLRRCLGKIGGLTIGLQQKKSNDRLQRLKSWIVGFISAFNQYGLQSQGAELSEGKNTNELMGWIDNYCRQHQGDDLHTASEAFIDDFRQRNRR